MKIRVAYTKNELEKKAAHEEAVRELFPDIKIKEAAPKGDYLHTYMTIPVVKNTKCR